MSDPIFPSVMRLVPQSGIHQDCTISTIAMACGVTYEEVLAVAAVIQPCILEAGLTWREIRRVFDDLGCDMKLQRRGFYDIDEDSGILNVKRGKTYDHVVILWDGHIIDGGKELWRDPEEYLKHYNYKPYSLLVRIG